MNITIRSIWARTKILLWPESYILVSLPHESLIEAFILESRAIR